MNALDRIWCTVRVKTEKGMGKAGKILQTLEVCAVTSDCCSLLMFRRLNTGKLIGPYEIYCFVGLSSSSQQPQDLIR